MDILPQATGITCDSREVSPGNLFVAIRGRQTDGNAYIREACRKGAIAVISDSPHPGSSLPVPLFFVSNARKALSALAAAFYQHPSQRLHLTGVTGTNGKTTITYMLKHILKTAGRPTGMIGTIETDLGGSSHPSRLTTPDAAHLQQYLQTMAKNGVTHAVMEVSAQGMEMNRTDDIHLATGILTNITADHLDFHGNFSAYVQAKRRFLDLLPPQAPLIANWDDPLCRDLAASRQHALIRAGSAPECDLVLDEVRLGCEGSIFSLRVPHLVSLPGAPPLVPQVLTIRLPLPGRHNVENAMLAAAGALLAGVSGPYIEAGLNSFQGVERRIQIVRTPEGTILDDTALNPASIDAVFHTVSQFRRRNLIVANAIRGKRGAAINAANAQIFADWQKKLSFMLYITAAAEAVSPADQVEPAEKAAFMDTLQHNGASFQFMSRLADAIKQVQLQMQPGDLVLLLGAQGMDRGRDILVSLLQPDLATQTGGYSQTLAAPVFSLP